MNDTLFLSGHSIELRIPTEEDMYNTNWHSWYNNMETTKYNSHGVYPVSVDQEYKIVKSIMDKEDTILCSIYDKNSSKLVGNAALQNIDLINRNCNLATTVGEKAPFTTTIEVWGLLIEHAFMRLNLHRVYDGTHQELKKLVDILSVLGVKEEGVSKDHFLRDDQYFDKINFAILKKDFLLLKQERKGYILFEDYKDLQKEIIKAAT